MTTSLDFHERLSDIGRRREELDDMQDELDTEIQPYLEEFIEVSGKSPHRCTSGRLYLREITDGAIYFDIKCSYSESRDGCHSCGGSFSMPRSFVDDPAQWSAEFRAEQDRKQAEADRRAQASRRKQFEALKAEFEPEGVPA